MVSQTTELKIPKLAPKKLSAMKRRAKALGLSATDYLKHLIENDLARDQRIRAMPLEAMAAPFQEAFKKMDDADIDRMVEQGRRGAKPKRRKA